MWWCFHNPQLPHRFFTSWLLGSRKANTIAACLFTCLQDTSMASWSLVKGSTNAGHFMHSLLVAMCFFLGVSRKDGLHLYACQCGHTESFSNLHTQLFFQESESGVCVLSCSEDCGGQSGPDSPQEPALCITQALFQSGSQGLHGEGDRCLQTSHHPPGLLWEGLRFPQHGPSTCSVTGFLELRLQLRCLHNPVGIGICNTSTQFWLRSSPVSHGGHSPLPKKHSIQRFCGTMPYQEKNTPNKTLLCVFLSNTSLS